MRRPAVTEETMIPISEPAAELPAVPPGRAPLLVRLVTLGLIVLPLLGLVAAPFFLWGWGFSWTDIGLLIGMYLLTALGITVGFHRLFVHRSFETYTWVKFVFAVLGSMAVQGSLFKWVAYHRKHHQHSDTPDDPHTPHHTGRGVLGVIAGAWHAHIGWFFQADPPDLDEYVKDLKKSRSLRVANALWPVWVVLGFALPALIGGLVKGSWLGVWTGLIWGGLVRVFLVHHVTWSVNSACHLWGWRPYKSEDESRNNIVFGILALGEGWHNAHHAFPTSARHGLSWWQIDVSYYLIRVMSWVGLAWKVKLPSEQVIERATSGTPTAQASPPPTTSQGLTR
jgi:stearoyl-CoA desaturase (Delta-9 desaturase)